MCLSGDYTAGVAALAAALQKTVDTQKLLLIPCRQLCHEL